jgi:simple sugar transport system ATP-binding protein
LTRRFGDVIATQGVDLTVRPGQIHALLGENGAGKSTLMNMVYGLLRPDEGEILWHGRNLTTHSPQAARRLGIGMVSQHFSVFESMTVLENIAVGLDRPVPVQALADRIRQVGGAYGLALDPARALRGMSTGERQRIEILRCLLQAPRLLMMDEPTSVLTPAEAAKLFETLRQLATEGCAILYISHKLTEIRALCSAATVLRAGRVVASCDPAEESSASLARMMMGAPLPAPSRPAVVAPGAARLEVNAVTVPGLHQVTLAVRAGEILGIAGIAGNGQGALFSVLSGEALAPSSTGVLIDGKPCGRLGTAARRQAGLCCVPEDRRGHAAVPDFSLADNVMLTGYHSPALVRYGLIRPGAAARLAERVIAAYAVQCSGPAAASRTLSGGNLQKFILGREILQAPGVLVAAQPSWGVDAGAAALIHRALRGLAAAGAAVVVMSQDMDELLALCDQLAVLQAGTLSAARPVAACRAEDIGLLMGGVAHHAC